MQHAHLAQLNATQFNATQFNATQFHTPQFQALPSTPSILKTTISPIAAFSTPELGLLGLFLTPVVANFLYQHYRSLVLRYRSRVLQRM